MSGKQSGREPGEETNFLAEGELVTIKGLQSDAGKALNGGYGIILGNPSEVESKDNRRYPILVYALVSNDDGSEMKLVSPLVKRSIKALNLEVKPNQKCEIFKQVALIQSHEAFGVKRDYKAALFWTSAYYERWPEDEIGMSITYANLLRQVGKQPKEAWKILRKVVPQMEEVGSESINESRYDACVTCVSAEGKAEEALEWALKIETDTTENKQLALEALDAVRQYCRGNFKRIVDLDSGDGPLLNVHLRTCKAQLEIDPENSFCMLNVASAYCMLEDNKEGVRFYRRALATGQLQGETLELQKRNLGLAMMQCPGGAMEHYRVVASMPDNFACVHKAAIGQYELYSAGDGAGRMTGSLVGKNGETVQVTLFPVPDIDDTELFQNVDLPPREE